MVEPGAGEPSEETLSPRGRSSLWSRFGWQWRIAFVALVGILVVGLGAYVVVGRGEGSCVAEAVAHLELGDGDRGVRGGDLVRARSAGMVDSGSPEDVAASVREMGVYVDPLTGVRGVGEQGYDVSDVECWVGAGGSDFAARGTFDVDEVESSELHLEGDLAATSQMLVFDTHGDAAAQLERQVDVDATVSRFLNVLDSEEVVSFDLVLPAADDTFTPVAVAQTYGDEWELLVVWLFDDSNAAGVGRDAVTELLVGGESRISEIIRGDPVEQLEQEGPFLLLQAPLNEPALWRDLFLYADPILNPVDT